MFYLFCGGARNRTQVFGFGDRSPATERHPHPPRRMHLSRKLYFLKDLVPSADFAELLILKLAGYQLLVLRAIVHAPLTLRALQLYQIVL